MIRFNGRARSLNLVQKYLLAAIPNCFPESALDACSVGCIDCCCISTIVRHGLHLSTR
ncbi:hypothetical protein YSA_09157 [Pseudomonas putida ND6]|uniref:Uncharacterized protein n=1 Tax=Pseudomonas putida ND6 TaxID=231023 RepID=I3V1V4_PSEPU|nr:hypothetical protein YSA_09157 [Pseudomonas putida ND6]